MSTMLFSRAWKKIWRCVSSKNSIGEDRLGQRKMLTQSYSNRQQWVEPHEHVFQRGDHDWFAFQYLGFDIFQPSILAASVHNAMVYLCFRYLCRSKCRNNIRTSVLDSTPRASRHSGLRLIYNDLGSVLAYLNLFRLPEFITSWVISHLTSVRMKYLLTLTALK